MMRHEKYMRTTVKIVEPGVRYWLYVLYQEGNQRPYPNYLIYWVTEISSNLPYLKPNKDHVLKGRMPKGWDTSFYSS